jgi:nucleotide-binding universal stress UspA family protein
MRVLVALDGKDVSEEIVVAVAHLTDEADEVHLLTVVHPDETHETVPRSGGADRSERTVVATPPGILSFERTVPEAGEDVTQAFQRVRTEHVAYLSGLAERLLPEVECYSHVEVGEDAAETIVREAARLEVHGIAMGTRERGAVSHTLPDSVAERVMRDANVPVLIVHEGLTIPRPAGQ